MAKETSRYVGELEQQLLWTILRLRNNAYGVQILDELEARAGRALSVGALYATLERLEAKGLLSSRVGEATPERGGRAKKYFSVTGSGVAAAQAAFDRLMALRRGVRARRIGTAKAGA